MNRKIASGAAAVAAALIAGAGLAGALPGLPEQADPHVDDEIVTSVNVPEDPGSQADDAGSQAEGHRQDDQVGTEDHSEGDGPDDNASAVAHEVHEMLDGDGVDGQAVAEFAQENAGAERSTTATAHTEGGGSQADTAGDQAGEHDDARQDGAHRP